MNFTLKRVSNDQLAIRLALQRPALMLVSLFITGKDHLDHRDYHRACECLARLERFTYQ